MTREHLGWDLPLATFDALAFDERGQLHVLTVDLGVVRRDGERWTRLTPGRPEDGIGVSGLAVRGGTLVIATYDAGVLLWDVATGKARQVELPAEHRRKRIGGERERGQGAQGHPGTRRGAGRPHRRGRRILLDAPGAARHPAGVRRALLLPFLALAACNGTTPLEIDVTPGLEDGARGDGPDAFTQSLAVDNVTVSVTSLDGTVNLSASTTPGGTFDLGDVPVDEQIHVAVTATVANTPVMGGQSLKGVLLSALDGASLPVFAERFNTWSRPPGGFATAHVGGVGAVLGEEYLLLTGGAHAGKDPNGNPKGVERYDLLSLTGAAGGVAFDRVAESLASLTWTDPNTSVPVEQVLAIDASGASWIDYAAAVGPTPVTPLPAGLGSWADVAGGAAVLVDDTLNSVFIVGATRPTMPTAMVLLVSIDQDTDTATLSTYKLTTPRAGAAAVWIDDVGLVVAGGSEQGPGVEVLTYTSSGGSGSSGIGGTYTFATGFGSRGFPADPVVGAGAAASGTNGMALIGGTANGMPAPTRVLGDLGCEAACTVSQAPAALPVALRNVNAYALGTGTRVLAVGDEVGGMGMTRVFAMDLTSAATSELPLRVPRRGAVPVPTPLGNLALLGGEKADGTAVTSIEMLLPQ
jgi:hypothetical protein